MGPRSKILKVSVELQEALEATGRKERFVASQVLFREDGVNVGVFLILKGKVRMSVRGLPKLDRVFTAGSVLGLPSTFTGHAYSLSAVATAEAETVQVSPEDFVTLMRERADLCREATEILGREVTFIQSALAERRKQMAAKKVSYIESPALM